MKIEPFETAFPTLNQIGADCAGLKKREYFAAFAMQGLLAGHADISVPSEVAKYAVLNADALIDELNKPKQ